MLREFMDSRTAEEKREISIRYLPFRTVGSQEESLVIFAIISLSWEEAWMQMALFIVPKFLTADQKQCWYLLSKVQQRNY